MVKINWMPQAIEDINKIAEYIAQDSFKYAKIQTERFFSATSILIKNPKIGRVVPEVNEKNIREIIIGSYRLVYRVISINQIDILTIHHSARLLKKIS